MSLHGHTGFKRDILFIIAEKGDPKGLTIKRVLDDLYEVDINHGRLYPNLDDLQENGLIEVGTKDKRTNEYTLTDKGMEEIEEHIDWQHSCVDDEE